MSDKEGRNDVPGGKPWAITAMILTGIIATASGIAINRFSNQSKAKELGSGPVSTHNEAPKDVQNATGLPAEKKPMAAPNDLVFVSNSPTVRQNGIKIDLDKCTVSSSKAVCDLFLTSLEEQVGLDSGTPLVGGSGKPSELWDADGNHFKLSTIQIGNDPPNPIRIAWAEFPKGIKRPIQLTFSLNRAVTSLATLNYYCTHAVPGVVNLIEASFGNLHRQ